MYETLRTCGHLGPVGPAWLGSSGAGGGESGCELPGPCVAIVVSSYKQLRVPFLLLSCISDK